MSAWQSIETAPKDGQKILAWCQPTYQETGKPMDFSFAAVVWWRRDKFNDSRYPWRMALNDGTEGTREQTALHG